MAFCHWLFVALVWVLEAKEIGRSASVLADLVAAAQTPAEDNQEWQGHWSQEYRRHYYFNSATDESYWFPPWRCICCGLYIPAGGYPVTLGNPYRQGRACLGCAMNVNMTDSESESE